MAAALAAIGHAMLLFGLPRLNASSPAGMTTNAFATRVVAAAQPGTPTPQAATDTEALAVPAPPREAKPPAPRKTAAAPKPRQTARAPRMSKASSPSSDQSEQSSGAPIERESSLLAAPRDFAIGPFPPMQPITVTSTAVDEEAARQQLRGSGDAPVLLPRAAQVIYNVSGRQGDLALNVPSTLLWRHDGVRYEVSLSFYHTKIGPQIKNAAGLLTPQGLAPFNATERSGAETKIRFDYGQQRALFEPVDTQLQLPPGSRDGLSALIQIGALLAAAPDKYPAGTAISLPVAENEAVSSSSFLIEGMETLTALTGKTLQALRVVRAARGDQQPAMEAWLSPALEYLPVRLRVTQANGDFVDHVAERAIPVTVLPPSAR